VCYDDDDAFNNGFKPWEEKKEALEKGFGGQDNVDVAVEDDDMAFGSLPAKANSDKKK